MSRIAELDGIARRGAPYPYPAPLLDDIRRAHVSIMNRTMLYGVAWLLVGLAPGLGLNVAYLLVDGVAARLPPWAPFLVLLMCLAAGVVLMLPHLLRARRHAAVLRAYDPQFAQRGRML